MTSPQKELCRPNRLAFAVCVALSSLTLPVVAEPMLVVPFYRQADMARWSDNYFEFGVVNVDATSNTRKNYKFGEWTGLNDGGTSETFGFNYVNQGQRLYGANIGGDTFKFLVEGGQQGTFTASASIDRITRSEIDSAKFIFDGLGSNRLSVPVGFAVPVDSIGGLLTSRNQADTENAAAIESFMKPFDIRQIRDTQRLNVSTVLSTEWDFKINVREDNRDGTILVGGSGVILPAPIQDSTRQVEAQLSYTTKPWQTQLTYSVSRYENSVKALRWENPYQPITTLVATTRQSNQLSLDPSNEFHHLSLTNGWALSKTTRLTAYLAQAVAKQEDPYLPYSANVAAVVTQALPRGHLGGRVVTNTADIALNTRPLEAMSLRVAYQYRGSDNLTPKDTYYAIGNDGTAQSLSNSTSIRRTTPIESQESKLTVDGDYEIMRRTKLRLALERKKLDYDYADAPSATEDKGLLELRRPVSEEFLGAVSVAHKTRRTDSYNKNQWFAASYPSPGAAATTATATTSAYFTNNPQMRSFMYGDHDEDRFRLNGNWNAAETVSVQGALDAYKQNNDVMNCANVTADAKVAAGTNAVNAVAPATTRIQWENDCLGRKSVAGNTLSLDTQWQIDEETSTFAFFTHADYTMKQRGRTWGAGSSRGQLQVADDVSRDFDAETNYRDRAFGLGAKWKPTDNLDLGGQYVITRSTGKTMVALVPGSSVTSLYHPTELPHTFLRIGSAQIYAKWNYNSRLSYRLNYMYEDMKAADWSYDLTTALSTNGALLTGQVTPRYTNHVIGASVAISTW